jgi:hypothetical protein
MFQGILLIPVLKEYQSSFHYKRFVILTICLMISILVDTSVVKVYDLINKSFIPEESKVILFTVNSSLCLTLGFLIIKYVHGALERRGSSKAYSNLLYRISLFSFLSLGALMSIIVFQQIFHEYYTVATSISVVAISYGTGAALIIRLSALFFSWFQSNRSWIILLFFFAMLLIAFQLIMTAIITGIKLSDRPTEIRYYVGGTVDISFGRYVLLDSIYRVSNIISFFSMWIATALLMNYYRERLVHAIAYWVILSIPPLYFLVNYLYEVILATIVNSYLTLDLITVSIVVTAFLSLSKPVGGLTFALAFWKISKTVSYEKNTRSYMAISGWGILLIFSANQGTLQSVAPYPPFGLATITVLITGAFLMALGIYNAAVFVSANTSLRKFIHQHAVESKLLSLIGHAEMEKEIQKTVNQLARDKVELQQDTKLPLELDEKELRKYIDFVLTEIKKGYVKR